MLTEAEFPEEMDAAQAAQYLKITERTLHDWTKERRFAYFQIGRRKMYLKADLHTYKLSCRVQAKPAPAA